MDPMGAGVVEALRQALEVSPDSVPPRRHPADRLRSLARPDGADVPTSMDSPAES